jgi:hypothetical protein
MTGGRQGKILSYLLTLGVVLLHFPHHQTKGFLRGPEVSGGPQTASVTGNNAFQEAFALKREIVLEKKSGTVTQLVVDKKGFLWVQNMKEGRIEKYDPNGRLVKVIGGAGQGPGRFLLLISFALDEEKGHVFAVDLQQSRINLFTQEGQFITSWIVARPGYMPDSIVLDGKRGFYYLGGSLPKRRWISEGSLHVHKYKLGTNEYVRSFLETDRSVKEKNLFNFLYVSSLDIDSLGNVYCTLAPVYKIFKIDTRRGTIQTFSGKHRYYKPPPVYPSSLKREELRRLRESWAQADRVLIVRNRFAVLSLEIHKPFPYGLEVFDMNGRVLKTDILTDGALVGKDHEGNLYFAVTRNGRYIIAQYSLTVPGKPARSLRKRAD